MLFPTSGVETPLWVPPLVGMVISFFTSMAGLSGAVLILPFQLSILNFTAPAVTSTNLVFNVVGIPSGAYRYCKEGRLDWHLALIISLGTLPGMIIGAVIRVICLPDPGLFKRFAGCFLLYVGSRIFYQLYKDRSQPSLQENEEMLRLRYIEDAHSEKPLNERDHGGIGQLLSRTEYETHRQGLRSHETALFSLSLTVGLLGGIYGVGGAAIISPIIVTFLGLPIHTVAGATLVSACITSIAGVLFYAFVCPILVGPGDLSVAPDWLLGAMFGVGGVVGMYFGACTQKYVRGITIKLAMAILISAVGLNYVIQCFP